LAVSNDQRFDATKCTKHEQIDRLLHALGVLRAWRIL
jgi:hypothetical protein